MIKLFGRGGLCWTDPLFEQPDRLGFSRTVSFSERVQVSEIPSVETLSKRQKNALWHKDPFKARSFARMQQVLCGMSSEYNDDGEEIGIGVNQKNHLPFPVSAVLFEQESQRDCGQRVDPSEIAKIYQRCSAHSAVRAQMRALECELDAQDYMYEPAKHGRYKVILLEEPI